LLLDGTVREADVVPEFDADIGGGAPSGGGRPLGSMEDVVARAQRLIDSPRPYDGYPFEWHFEALNVGDLTAIAIVAIRAADSVSDTA